MGLFDIMNDGKKPDNGEKGLVRKYATSPLPMGKGRTLADVSKEVGKQLGINPNMLASSSLVEGANILFNPKSGSESSAYQIAAEGGMVDRSKYPVDAFLFAGLDNFGSVADKLKTKGYLPKDVDFKVFPAWNEQTEKSIAKFDKSGNISSYVMPKDIVDKAYFGQGKERQSAVQEINRRLKDQGVSPVQTVAFSNTEDMVKAKGAYLKLLQDETIDYAKKKGIAPKGEELDYLVMSAYNGGPGAMQELVDQIKAGEKEITKKGGKKQQVHQNVSKRLGYMGYMSDIFN